jgi:hypothetical protein
LELYAADGSLGKHLNGLELIVKGESLGIIGGNSETCIPIEDNLVVLGRSDDAGENGGVAVDIMLPGFALPNTDVSVILSKGATVYDFAYYDGPTDGVAVQLDPEWLSVDYNDNPENWCDSKIAYNETPELGTPGDGNPSCTAEFCMENGVAAALKQFYPDQLVITEVYANPDGADGKKEWFEIFVEPDASPAHLNGLGILKSVGEEPDYIFSTMQCLELSPGEHYVLCRSADPEENGGLTDCIEYGSVTLVNSNGVLGLGKPGLLVDLVPSYGTAADGISRSLDPEYYSASGNDSKDHWCNTPDSNKFSDGVGTPGKVNPSCD